jgi:hypothetical protein
MTHGGQNGGTTGVGIQTVPRGDSPAITFLLQRFLRFVISLNSSIIVVYVVKSLHLLFIQMLSLSYTAQLGNCSYRTVGSRHSRSGPAVPNPLHLKICVIFYVCYVKDDVQYLSIVNFYVHRVYITYDIVYLSRMPIFTGTITHLVYITG